MWSHVFAFVVFALVSNSKIIANTNIKITAYVFFWECYGFRSLVNFELIFTYGVSLHVVSSFPNIIYWRDCSFLIVSFWLLCCMFGEGNGTPLQYSCLENPMDGGAW